MSKRILIVEDDPHISLGLVEALGSEGYETGECRDGGQALPLIRQWQPDLVVLDVMLPRKSGYDICRELRGAGNGVRILMLTAKSQEADKVIGLELGADDYLAKPFGLRELIARVHALLRRGERPGGFPVPDTLRIGAIQIAPAALRGEKEGAVFDLTPREMAVLAVLYRERGRAVSRQKLLDEVWGRDYYGTTRTLDQLVVKIRQKIEETPSAPQFLLTVHGMGYRLEV